MAWSQKVRLSLSFECSVYLGPNRPVKGAGQFFNS